MPSPLLVNVTPLGSAPVIVMSVAVGWPDVVIRKLLAVPTVQVVLGGTGELRGDFSRRRWRRRRLRIHARRASGSASSSPRARGRWWPRTVIEYVPVTVGVPLSVAVPLPALLQEIAVGQAAGRRQRWRREPGRRDREAAGLPAPEHDRIGARDRRRLPHGERERLRGERRAAARRRKVSG